MYQKHTHGDRILTSLVPIILVLNLGGQNANPNSFLWFSCHCRNAEFLYWNALISTVQVAYSRYFIYLWRTVWFGMDQVTTIYHECEYSTYQSRSYEFNLSDNSLIFFDFLAPLITVMTLKVIKLGNLQNLWSELFYAGGQNVFGKPD